MPSLVFPALQEAVARIRLVSLVGRYDRPLN